MNCRMRRLLAKIRLKNRQKYKANGKGGDKRQELKKKRRQITGCRNRAVIRGKETNLSQKRQQSYECKIRFHFVFIFKESNKVAVCI